MQRSGLVSLAPTISRGDRRRDDDRPSEAVAESGQVEAVGSLIAIASEPRGDAGGAEIPGGFEKAGVGPPSVWKDNEAGAGDAIPQFVVAESRAHVNGGAPLAKPLQSPPYTR